MKLANIVLAGSLSPSMFDKYFFIKHEIIMEEEMIGKPVFDPLGLTNVITKNYTVVITNGQILIENSNDTDFQIEEVALKILKATTNESIFIIAMGFNYHRFFSIEGTTMEEITRKSFYNEKVPILTDHFSASDSSFGIYASTNFRDARMKLEVKPFLTHQVGQTLLSEPSMGFLFNFHFEINNNWQLLEKALTDFNDYTEKSNEIFSTFKY